MSWSAERIELLKGESQQARRQIATLFRNAIVHPNNDEGLAAWGQYLNMPAEGRPPQHGIYGTTAGIQVLAAHDTQGFGSLLAQAAQILPDLEGEETEAAQRVQDYFEAKGDLRTVYKMAAVAEAISPERDAITGPHPLVTALKDLLLHDGGWGDYFTEDDPTNYSNTIATATALTALARYQAFRETQECRRALDWLCRNTDTSLANSSELALILLALTAFRDDERDPPVRKDVRDGCVEQLRTRMGRFTSDEIRRDIDFHEYLIPLPSGTGPVTKAPYSFHYMFYLPHCLVALALIRQPPSELSHGGYILTVIETIVQDIRSGGYFAAARRTRISSVDHLWIYRLLKAFESMGTEDLVEETLLGRLRQRFFGRRILALFVGFFALWSLVWLIAERILDISVSFLAVPIISILSNIVTGLLLEAFPLIRPPKRRR
jgi:hypothetical protein